MRYIVGAKNSLLTKESTKKWGIKNLLLNDYPQLIFTTQEGNCFMPTQAEKRVPTDNFHNE